MGMNDVKLSNTNSVMKLQIICLFFLITSVFSLPFVVFHGLDNSCDEPMLIEYIERLEVDSGNHGHCIEIGDGKHDSVFMPLMDQLEIACQKIKELDEIKNGYNIVGISQGNMISRGIIETCDHAPPVMNYISLGGPHAGQAAPPNCYGLRLCEIFAPILFSLPLYDICFQGHLAPTNFIKIPTKIEEYHKGCKFLPVINNEIESVANVTYKERFASLENLVLVMFDNETVLVPKETSWFGYYGDGSTEKLLPTNETTLYKEDWIGLRALDEAGNVTYVTAPGGHCNISEYLFEAILPFLKDDEPLQVESLVHDLDVFV